MRQNVSNILSVLSHATTEEVACGKQWYLKAHWETSELHDDIRIGSAVVAALSPGLRWERNIEAADRVINGRSLDGLGVRWYDGVRKAEKILGGQNPDNVLKGNKVRAFWKCIESPLNPLFVCVDGHAWGIWSGNRTSLDKVPSLTTRIYNRIAFDYTAAAEVAGMLPLEVQAITWCVWRRIHGVANGGNGHKKSV